MAKAAPLPIFRTLFQNPSDGIAMDVAEFFDPLGFALDVEIVVSRLPGRRAFDRVQLARAVLL